MKAHLIPITLPGWPSPSAMVLLDHTVRKEWRRYRQRQQRNRAGAPVEKTKDELDNELSKGKVEFGLAEMVAKEMGTVEQAIRAVREAFIDEIFIMIVDGKRIRSLNTVLSLDEGSEVSYVRLASLRGSY